MKAHPIAKFTAGIPFKKYRKVGNWILVDDAEPTVAPRRDVGLGDVVYWAARKTGLDKLAKLYERKTGKPCGCAERRKKLNKIRLAMPIKQPNTDK